MKILVLGGTGFIGSNLVFKLSKNKNNKIVIVDNLSTGNLSNIKKILIQDNIEFIKMDICDTNIIDFIKEKILILYII